MSWRDIGCIGDGEGFSFAVTVHLERFDHNEEVVTDVVATHLATNKSVGQSLDQRYVFDTARP